MIEFQNVTAGYPGRTVVDSVSFLAPKGRITALIGPNGCGKTTLLKTACGLLSPSSGQVLLNGRPTASYRRRERARWAALLPQTRETPAITVERLVAHGRYPHLGFARDLSAGDRILIEKAMEDAGVLDLRRRELASLSGGERQRAYIAMALAQDSQALLLDEPTTYLDIGQQYEILELIQRLNRQGKTVLMVLHDLPLSFAYSHWTALLVKGRLVAYGPSEEVFLSRAADQAFGVSGRKLRLDGKDRYLFFGGGEASRP